MVEVDLLFGTDTPAPGPRTSALASPPGRLAGSSSGMMTPASSKPALRDAAAVRIGGSMRRAMMQRRYRRFVAAMREWRFC